MKIYTEFGKQKTIKQFIKLLFNNEMHGNKTNVTTYKDPQCKYIQCASGRYRSFDDVYDCIKTYYPKTNPKQVFHALLTVDLLTYGKKPLYLHMANCTTIYKQRMLYYHNEDVCYKNYNCAKYRSKWSWVELLEMLGINSIEGIKKYVKKHRKNETL